MSLSDGKVHISTGLYWGLLVSYIGGYSTFFSGLAWFLIVGYHTHETFHYIVNTICKNFYQRVISSSIDNILDELASYGFNNSINTVGSFAISCLKHCFPPAARASEGCGTAQQLPVQSHEPPSATNHPNMSSFEHFARLSNLPIETRRAKLLAKQNQLYGGWTDNVDRASLTQNCLEISSGVNSQSHFQESMRISSPKKAPSVKIPSNCDFIN